MKFGSLFTGVGGFDLGLERAGLEAVWQVEFDGQARSVLDRHWPDVELHKDVRDVGDSNLARVDLVCGGFPCQDVSVAGKRAGLAGERSGLWWEFHRIIGELAPAWVLIENVPGLLSSNQGRDMSTVVRGLEELGYGWSYRVLDSQYFGVAQRRRRVFIVGCAGGFCPPEILLEPEGLLGDSAPSREAREEVAGTLGGRAAGEGGQRNDLDNHGAYPLQEVTGRTGRSTEDPTIGIGIGSVADPMYTLKAGQQHGVSTPLTTNPYADNESQEPKIVVAEVAQTLTAMMYRSGGASAGNNPGVRNVFPAVYRKAQKAHDPDDHERWEEAEYANTLNGQGDTAGVVPLAYADLAPTMFASGAGTDRTASSESESEFVVGAVPRRLTPTECERLQGFPDGWTEGLADGPRYRMMGNAVTVDVIEWIGRRLMNQIREV